MDKKQNTSEVNYRLSIVILDTLLMKRVITPDGIFAEKRGKSANMAARRTCSRKQIVCEKPEMPTA